MQNSKAGVNADTDAKLERAKDIAARKALETYVTELAKACSDQGIPVGCLAPTGHIHFAVLFDGTSGVVVRAEWIFDDNPSVLNAMLARAKKEGTA